MQLSNALHPAMAVVSLLVVLGPGFDRIGPLGLSGPVAVAMDPRLYAWSSKALGTIQ